MTTENLKLEYTILCDDVRLEAGNKISLMGVFQSIMIERAPVTLIKFAIVQHWQGAGEYLTEIRVLSADKTQVLMASQPTPIRIQPDSFADNVSFFVNAVFPTAGNYWIQTLVDATLYDEFTLNISEVNQNENFNADDGDFPEIVN